MNHVIKESLTYTSNLKELIRKIVDNFLKERKWIEIPIYDNLTINIKLEFSQNDSFADIFNAIYSIKPWISQKYSNKVSIFFTT